jgi:hypothetical protein
MGIGAEVDQRNSSGQAPLESSRASLLRKSLSAWKSKMHCDCQSKPRSSAKAQLWRKHRKQLIWYGRIHLNCDLAANLDDLIWWQSQMLGDLGAISLHCGVNGFNDAGKAAMSLLRDDCLMAHIICDI